MMKIEMWTYFVYDNDFENDFDFKSFEKWFWFEIVLEVVILILIWNHFLAHDFDFDFKSF